MKRPGETPAQRRVRERAQRQQAELRDQVAEVLTIGKRLGQVGPDLIARASIPAIDGYGTGRRMDEGGSSRGGVGDPVGALVAAKLDGVGAAGARARAIELDPVGLHVAEALAHLAGAVDAMRRADDACRAAVRVTAAEAVGEVDRRPPGCVNCDRFDVWSAVHKAGRCRACYEYKRRSPQDLDATEEIVRSRPEVSGRRQYKAAEETGTHG